MSKAKQPRTRDDPVNHPGHYTFGRFEVIDVLEDWFPADLLLWHVGKYIARADRKGNLVEDLKKAAWYLQRRIEKEEGRYVGRNEKHYCRSSGQCADRLHDTAGSITES
ncbi:MAG: DUF3310 domain-containing protein [Spirochaetaceae bacterium]|nr:DUF3310 domain-containing protein [Spirochaetaceae bacterium]